MLVNVYGRTGLIIISVSGERGATNHIIYYNKGTFLFRVSYHFALRFKCVMTDGVAKSSVAICAAVCINGRPITP